jgi:hypothetical protein
MICALQFALMNANVFLCPVCGGPMTRVKVLPNKLSGLVRYKCTCGHCEDVKDDHKTTPKFDESFVLEGFQELP